MSNKGMPRITEEDLTMPWSNGQRIRAIETMCATCDKPFLAPASQPRKYCSQACYQGRPSKVAMRDCVVCGTAFRPKEKAMKYCSHACYSEDRRGPRVARVKDQRYVMSKGHAIAPPSGLVALARLTLYDKLGPGEHSCHWCEKLITWQRGLTADCLVADHLDWDRNNDAPDNLVASCLKCNAHRTRVGNRTVLTDDDLTMMWSGVRTRAVKRECSTCGAEFLTIPAAVKAGKGRFCSRSCANRQPRKPKPAHDA